MSDIGLSKARRGLWGRKWGRKLAGGVVGIFAGALVSGPLMFAVGPYTIFNSDLQSPKVDAVWGELEPLPLMVSNPAGYALILAVLGAGTGSRSHWPCLHRPRGTARVRVRACPDH